MYLSCRILKKRVCIFTDDSVPRFWIRSRVLLIRLNLNIKVTHMHTQHKNAHTWFRLAKKFYVIIINIWNGALYCPDVSQDLKIILFVKNICTSLSSPNCYQLLRCSLLTSPALASTPNGQVIYLRRAICKYLFLSSS